MKKKTTMQLYRWFVKHGRQTFTTRSKGERFKCTISTGEFPGQIMCKECPYFHVSLTNNCQQKALQDFLEIDKMKEITKALKAIK